MSNTPKNQSSLLGCHRARFARLLSPTEASEAMAQFGIDEQPAGWLLYAELSERDLHLLNEIHRSHSRLTVTAFEDGLPVVVLTAQVRGVRFQWAVPMWESGAQEWLRDCSARKCIELLIRALDAPVCMMVKTSDGVFFQGTELLAAASVERAPLGKEHLFSMLNAGLHLMNDMTPPVASDQASIQDLRVMVMGRGKNASQLMNTFVAGAKVVQSLIPTAKEGVL